MKNLAPVFTAMVVMLLFPVVSAPTFVPLEGAPPSDPGGGGNGGGSSGQMTLVLVANSIDYPLALDFAEFLEERFNLVSVGPGEFDSYRFSTRIVILGGPDAYEGIGNITKWVLSSEEQEETRKVGSHAMYIKEDIFTPGQKVIVIAGAMRNETRLAHMENRENVAELLS